MDIRRRGGLLAIVGLAASIALLGACSSGGDAKGDDKPASGASKAQTIAVTMKDNIFEPKEITVEKGAVTIELKNAGAALHNMHIMSSGAEGKDFMSKATIEGGAADKFTATFTKPGTYKFQCDFHVPDMAGTITVK